MREDTEAEICNVLRCLQILRTGILQMIFRMTPRKAVAADCFDSLASVSLNAFPRSRKSTVPHPSNDVSRGL